MQIEVETVVQLEEALAAGVGLYIVFAVLCGIASSFALLIASTAVPD